MKYEDAVNMLKRIGTNGCNYDIFNEDILAKISDWNTRLQIEVIEVAGDFVTVHFKSLPTDTKAFAQEIYEFCPDTVDQHFGCFAEMIETAVETGEELPEELKELVEGVDLSEDGYGLLLLERSLKKDGQIQLWWD